MTAVAGRVAAAIAAEEPELVLPLMEGLQGDLLPRDDHAAERLGVRLHSFDAGRRARAAQNGSAPSRWPRADEHSHRLDRDRRAPRAGVGDGDGPALPGATG